MNTAYQTFADTYKETGDAKTAWETAYPKMAAATKEVKPGEFEPLYDSAMLGRQLLRHPMIVNALKG